MKFVNVLYGNQKHLGLLQSDDSVFLLSELGILARDMNDLICNFSKFSESLDKLDPRTQKSHKIPQEHFLAPIEEPLQDVICLGINFLDHAKESAKFKGQTLGERKFPVYFSKRVNCATAPYAEIPLHAEITSQLDYECELAVILGKEAYKIRANEAKDYIFGYTILNDISARDLQAKHQQFYRAKSLEGSTIMGPCIISRDEIAYPPKLNLKSYVNGELRQDSSTEYFIFDIGYVLEELSAGMRLKAGTIISMGTPSGVGMGFNPPRFLKDGDRVQCEIENIGYICNTISKFL